MRISRVVVTLLSVLLIGAIAAPIHAQGDPSMLFWVADASGAQTRIVAIVDDLAGQELFNYAQADVDVTSVIISRDTQSVAMTLSSKADATTSVWYRHAGAAPVTIPNAQVTAFTPDSAYLLYQWALFQSFGIGVVNLNTGKQLEFIGARTEAQGVKGGAAAPLHFDGSTLYAVGYLPFSDAGPFGLYSFDLAANVQDIANKSGRFDLPPAASVTQVDNYGLGGHPLISPDGTQIAFLANDPGNVPTNLPDMPFQPNTNVLYVVNLATRAATRLAQAGPGQLLMGLSWMSDSRGLVFAGGSYGSINTVYTASVDGNVQPLGVLNAGAGNIMQAAICGRYVYVTWSVGDGSGALMVKRASLTDLTALQDVGSTDTMRMLGCSA
ncbi:MAG: hypothetical protein KF716_21990 [Anaerolineae bacterium]|nr:hypothetical protein [Anaerolineae bacterium]